MKPALAFSTLLLFLTACGANLASPPTTPATGVLQSPVAPARTSTASPTQTARPPSATPRQEPSAEAAYPLGPDDFPSDVNPLTGLPADDPDLLDRRPVAIKVSNYPRSNRPQWGLSLADLVFEYYHNNDLTRFHAIFYGNDAELVGPVRSARPFDDYLISLYKSNFASGSADYRIRNRLESQDYADRLIFLLDGVCPPQPVCRYQPDTVNYLLAGTSAIGDYLSGRGVDDVRQPLDGMTFDPKAPSGGENAERVYIRYSYAAYLYWEYDPESGRYLRYQDTQEDLQGRGEGYDLLTDRLTEQPIAADNLVVLFISHFYQVYQPPSGGNPAVEIVDMQFTGRGDGYAFRDGRAYPVTWVRPTDDSVLYLLNPDGSPYPFKPGNTWFQILGLDPLIETDSGVWRFEFILQ